MILTNESNDYSIEEEELLDFTNKSLVLDVPMGAAKLLGYFVMINNINSFIDNKENENINDILGDSKIQQLYAKTTLDIFNRSANTIKDKILSPMIWFKFILECIQRVNKIKTLKNTSDIIMSDIADNIKKLELKLHALNDKHSIVDKNILVSLIANPDDFQLDIKLQVTQSGDNISIT